MLCDASQRLMALLRGERVAKPPFYEPWFAMGRMLQEHYDGEYLNMAADLGHAAAPCGGTDVGLNFVKQIERIEATGVHYEGGTLRRVEQIRQAPEPDYDAQVEPLLARRRQIADAGRACWMIIGWCFDRMSANMGLEHLAMAFYDEPEFMHEAMRTYEARNRKAVEKVVAKIKPDFVLYNGDCAFKNGPMVAPDMIREFCFEPSRKTVEMVRDLDIPFAFHTDGQLDHIIPILLDLGICAVHGCEKQANDLRHLVETFGDDIVLCGNMDVVELKNATVEQTRDMTIRMLETGASKQKFIAGCNTSPQDYIPMENYQAFCRTVAEWTP